MICPACQKNVGNTATQCYYCGQNLVAYRSLEETKREILDARGVLANLETHLIRIESTLEKLSQNIFTPPIESELIKGSQPQESTSEQKHPEKDEFNSVAVVPDSGSEESIKTGIIDKIDVSQPTKSDTEAKSHDEKPGLPFKEKTVDKSEGELNFGQKWLLIAGVTLTVLAVGYFLKYSFEKNWVSPSIRVVMAFFIGIGMLGGGEAFRRKKLEMFGLYMIGGGIATLFFATFAGFQIYQLIPQYLAFILMIAITVLAGVLSLVYDTKWLAVLGLTGGFITPVVLGGGTQNDILLLLYLSLLNLGVLGIAFYKRWNLLYNLGFFFTWSIYTVWFLTNHGMEKFWLSLSFTQIFFLFYTVVPFSYYLTNQTIPRIRDFSLTIPNTFVAFGYTYGLVMSEYEVRWPVSLASLSYAAVFLILGNWLYRQSPGALAPLIVLLGKATLFLYLTIPLLFSGHWITLFWAGEGLILAWVYSKVNNRWTLAASLIVMGTAWWKFYFHDYPELYELTDSFTYAMGYPYLVTERWFSTTGMILGLFLYSRLVQNAVAGSTETHKQFASLLWIISGFSLFASSTIEVNAFFYTYFPDARIAAISVHWAIFSIILILLGFIWNQKTLRQVSLLLFGLTALKVLVVDMKDVDTPYRILSLVVLGVLMIGASFLYHRFASRVLAKKQTGETNE